MPPESVAAALLDRRETSRKKNQVFRYNFIVKTIPDKGKRRFLK